MITYAGYKCSVCGCWVGASEHHSCGGSAMPTPGGIRPTGHTTASDRIAAALERIAAALERDERWKP